MKKLLFIILLLPVFSYSQMKIDTIKKEVSFSKVYEVDQNKKDLHQKAQEWIAINFKDANEVIKLNTDDKIIAKGYFNVSYTSSGYPITSKIYFITELAFKESKYKLDMHTFKLTTSGIELAAESFFLANDYNYYVSLLKKQSEAATDSFSKKYYSKLFNNPDKLKKTYEKYLLSANQISSSINLEVIATSESLNQYISEKSESDW